MGADKETHSVRNRFEAIRMIQTAQAELCRPRKKYTKILTTTGSSEGRLYGTVDRELSGGQGL